MKYQLDIESKLIVQNKTIKPINQDVKLPDLKDKLTNSRYQNVNTELVNLLFNEYQIEGVTVYLSNTTLTDPKLLITKGKENIFNKANHPLMLILINVSSKEDTFRFTETPDFNNRSKGITLLKGIDSIKSDYQDVIFSSHMALNSSRGNIEIVEGKLDNVQLINARISIPKNSKLKLTKVVGINSFINIQTMDIYNYNYSPYALILNNVLLEDSNILKTESHGETTKLVNLRVIHSQLKLRGSTIIQNNRLESLRVTLPRGIYATSRFDLDIVSTISDFNSYYGFLIARSGEQYKIHLIPVIGNGPGNADVDLADYSGVPHALYRSRGVFVSFDDFDNILLNLYNPLVEEEFTKELSENIGKLKQHYSLTNNNLLVNEGDDELLIRNVLSRVKVLKKITNIELLANYVKELETDNTEEEFPF